MAIHSSILAWKAHGQRNLVGYSPWGCKGVGHELTPEHEQEHSGGEGSLPGCRLLLVASRDKNVKRILWEYPLTRALSPLIRMPPST